MGIYSELEFDRTRCAQCGRLLHKHYGGKRMREAKREYDGDLCDVVIVNITCANCGYVNEVTWSAQLPTTPRMARIMAEQQRRRFPYEPRNKGLFGCAPTV